MIVEAPKSTKTETMLKAIGADANSTTNDMHNIVSIPICVRYDASEQESAKESENGSENQSKNESKIQHRYNASETAERGRQGWTGGGGERERISNCVYEAATISRLPKDISLFCKRALQKRTYSAT